MRRRSALVFLTLLLVLLPTATVGAADPPQASIRYQVRFDSLPLAGLAEMIRLVNDFPPGSATPPHTHPGLTVVTILSGELTFRNSAGDKVYKAGESFAERPNEVVTALNAGAVNTRLIVSLVVPKGAAPSAAQPGAATPAVAPATLYLTRADAFFPGDTYEVAQAILDFAPGAQTPMQTHPGQVFNTVLEGEVTFTSGGATTVYKTGDTYLDAPGVAGQARNAGAAPATLSQTYLLPKGAALATPQAAPAAGGGGMARRATAPLALLAALALGGALLGAGLLERRRRRA